MAGRLSRLFYVHDGDPGALGASIEESRRVLQLPLEGSGVIGLGQDGKSAAGPFGRSVSIRIDAVALANATPEVRAVAQGQTPCVVGQAGNAFTLLVGRAGMSRSNASLGDLRGKIRYGLARSGWDLE